MKCDCVATPFQRNSACDLYQITDGVEMSGRAIMKLESKLSGMKLPKLLNLDSKRSFSTDNYISSH